MPDPRSFLPLTPLAFQVLLALADAERHGYGIIREVDTRTDGLIKLARARCTRCCDGCWTKT